MRLLLSGLAVAFLFSPSSVPAEAQGGAAWNAVLSDQSSGTTVLLQAVSAVNEHVVWVSGHRATYARTTDGGKTWRAGTVPGDTTLQFRDVHAFNEKAAFLLSAGSGKASRIYFTGDGGKNWTLQHTNPDSSGFYDCMSFWDLSHGLVYGDEVDGKAVILGTNDGGAHWGRLAADRLPAVRKGEGGFAASGTCLVTLPGGEAWIGTGAGLAARVFHTSDYGASWSAVETPVFHGSAASGIATIAVRNPFSLLAAGGDIGDPNGHTDNVAVSSDGGVTWALAGRPAISGAVYGSAYVPNAPTPSVVMVSPKGAVVSTDNGTTWASFDTRAYWAVGFATSGTGWMVGPQGRITRVESH